MEISWHSGGLRSSSVRRVIDVFSVRDQLVTHW